VKLKAAGLVVVVVGLITFFLPLVSVQGPIVGEQQISGWEAVKPSGDKGRDNANLRDTLEGIRRDVLRQKSREVPFAIEQANSLVVVLPLAYASLLVGGAFVLLQKPRWLQIAAGVGLLACVWSLISVAWLSSGVKEMVAGAGDRKGRCSRPASCAAPNNAAFALTCRHKRPSISSRRVRGESSPRELPEQSSVVAQAGERVAQPLLRLALRFSAKGETS